MDVVSTLAEILYPKTRTVYKTKFTLEGFGEVASTVNLMDFTKYLGEQGISDATTLVTVSTQWKTLIKEVCTAMRNMQVAERASRMDLSGIMDATIGVDVREDSSTKNKFIIFNDKIAPISYQSWVDLVGREILASADRVPATREYNPTKLSSKWVSTPEDSDAIIFPVYNTYKAPQWKVRRVRGEKGSVDPRIEEFFEHFVPDMACREYLFERMMMIVNGRLPIILVMNTLTGTGKGLFVESILKVGVGMTNFITAPPSWDKSGFNAWMCNTQVVWFDEEEVRPDGKDSNTNYLKRLVNDYQAIEVKGKDVSNPIKVWGSLIITNNQGTKNFRLEEDNRRFSVLDVAQEKMVNVLGKERTQEIADAIANNTDGIVDEFWLWLADNYSTSKYGGEFELWKGATYDMFLYESRTMWQKGIIDLCRSGEYVSFTDKDLLEHVLNRVTSESQAKIPYHHAKIDSFLKEYTTLEGLRLGSLEQGDRKGYVIRVNPVFVKEGAVASEGMAEIYGEKKDNTAEKIQEVEDMLNSMDEDIDDL